MTICCANAGKLQSLLSTLANFLWQLQAAAHTQICNGSMNVETCQTSMVFYLKASHCALLTACRPMAGQLAARVFVQDASEAVV